jgi:hypothetical protein
LDRVANGGLVAWYCIVPGMVLEMIPGEAADISRE